MSLDRITEQFVYGMGNATGIVANVSPVTAITMTSLKTGARFGRTFISFGKGGWYNLGFYANSLSACCSGASLALQCVSYGTCACPAVAVPLYAASQACGATADVLDSTFGIATLF